MIESAAVNPLYNWLARMLVVAAAATLAPAAWAQGAPAGTSGDASIAGLALLRTDLDGGGDFRVNAGYVNASWGGAIGSGLSGELTFRYSYQDWSFSTPNALGAQAPWGAIQTPGVGFNLRYAFNDKLVGFVGPQMTWSYETGASAGDAQSYGATFGVTSIISPTLMLGIGGGAFRQIDRTRVLPFVLVNWQIDDKWRLGNPLQAGPTGGPGIELAYAINDGWEAAGGVAFRDSRFRLRSDGPVPNGIGVDKGVPLFARLTWKAGANGRIDFYAGAIVGGELRVLDSSGSTLSSSDYDAAPLLGISASLRF